MCPGTSIRRNYLLDLPCKEDSYGFVAFQVFLKMMVAMVAVKRIRRLMSIRTNYFPDLLSKACSGGFVAFQVFLTKMVAMVAVIRMCPITSILTIYQIHHQRQIVMVSSLSRCF